MTARERPGDAAVLDARRTAAALARELRDARLALGISQATVARAAGLPRSRVGRLERDAGGSPDLEELFRAARPLGLRPAVRLFPVGSPVRDRAHLSLLARLEQVLGDGITLTREVALPVGGDLRAWDGWLQGHGDQVAVEAETHLRDVQELQRRIAGKRRDDPRVGRVLLVLTRSAHNRTIAREHREALRDLAPMDSGAALRLLRRGELPPVGGLLLV